MKVKRNSVFLIGTSVFLTLTYCRAPLNQDRVNDREPLLYNGIKLPAEWPPRYPVSEEPTDMPVPYLETVPDIIPVNVGRQLLTDDFLIEETDLVRTFHYPHYYNGNPVLEPDKPWEYTASGYPYAAPFSDGIWYDEKDRKFKMWYSTGGGELNKKTDRFNVVTAFAISDDGIHWKKPVLDVVPGTNLVDIRFRDSNSIWLDKNEQDPTRRYKLFNVENGWPDDRWRFVLKYSSDGIHWSEGVAQSGDIYDRSTVFYNPFRDKWVFSLRVSYDLGRSRNYLEQDDPEIGVSLAHRSWGTVDKNIVYWFGPWKNELTNPNPEYSNVKPAIYNHDAIAYESLLLGFFSVWQGPENEICENLGVQKRNEVAIGFSRDGFHWQRPDMNRFFPVDKTKGAWNFGNIQSVCGAPIIVSDSLYFYMSGRRQNNNFWDSYSSTGLATLRRDGFASLDAGNNEGIMLTRKLKFDGKYLFVNADASEGLLLAEVLNEDGQIIDGYTKGLCLPVKTNGTKLAIKWKNKNGIERLSGKPVRIRFFLKNTTLYSFWISKYKSGESEGYTSGGGPDLHPSGRDFPLN
jgi:hypothetical protein